MSCVNFVQTSANVQCLFFVFVVLEPSQLLTFSRKQTKFNLIVPIIPFLIFCLFLHALSDEAIAAFLETSGELLQELSLNNVKKVWNPPVLSENLSLLWASSTWS